METKVCKCCGRELPIDKFYTHKSTKDGLSNTCKECHRASIRASKYEKQELRRLALQGGKKLEDYTPRELMQELARRGYRGKLEYIEKHTIDLETINE